MAKKRHTAICLVFSLLLLQGCSKEWSQSFSDLYVLREALIKEYKVEDIAVTIQNMKIISVSFVNSHFNNLRKQEKEAKAREMALFVKKHYVSMDKIEAIQVTFVVHETYFFIFEWKNALDTFFFKKSEL